MNKRSMPPGSQLFVEVPEILQSTVTTENGVTLFIDPSFEPEQHAQVNGKVYSLGGRCKLNLKEDDEIAISYHMAADYYTLDDGSRKFNRAHNIDDKLVWLCDEGFVMARKVDGERQAVGDWVLLKAIPENEIKSSLIIIPDTITTKYKQGKCTFLSGDLEVPVNSTVLFEEIYRSVYKFKDGTEFVILKKDRIYGYE
jgi:co-chaperonin GroES (HSP10)